MSGVADVKVGTLENPTDADVRATVCRADQSTIRHSNQLDRSVSAPILCGFL
jgi:hypothetical protein